MSCEMYVSLVHAAAVGALIGAATGVLIIVVAKVFGL